MSNSNSKVMTNNANRSIFSYRKGVKTTQGFGAVGVTNIELGLPGDTIKTRKGSFYELKPTTDRIASRVTSRELSAMVPMKAIMRYWPEFLSKGDMLVQNGAQNVPHIENLEQQTVSELPFVYVLEPIAMLMASMTDAFASGNLAARYGRLYYAPGQIYLSNTDTLKYNGNKQDYSHSYISSNGNYVTQGGGLGAGDREFFWLPRLIGNGIEESGINVNYKVDPNDNTRQIRTYHFTDPNSVALARVLFNFMKINLNGISFNLTESEVKALTITVMANENLDYTSFAVGVSENNYAIPAYTPNNATFPGAFKVYKKYVDVNHYYGTIEFDGNFNGQYYTSNQSAKTLNITANNGGAIAGLCFAAACQALFNHSSLLGYGSLSESLGHHYFDEVTYRDLYTKYIGSTSGVLNSLLGISDATISIIAPSLMDLVINVIINNNGVLNHVDTPKINILPYFAYQKVLTDRFLLPHNVLSNNPGQDGTINYSVKYDSPYFRNNMVPTCYFGHPNLAISAFAHSCFYAEYTSGGTPWQYKMLDNTSPDVNQWHFIIPINQMLTIFFDRGYLMDMDAMTEIWQKQDMSTNDLLQSAGYGNFSNGVVNAKSWLIAKKLGKMFWFGGTDQTASDVLKNHFGVNTPDCDHEEVIALSSDRNVLDTQDVLNTGGAVDSDGTNRPLGDKVTICSNAFPVSNKYQVHCPDYVYILDLHWFTVKNERSSVPQPGVRLFEKIMEQVGNTLLNFKLFTFAEFQSIGDDMLTLADVKSFAPETIDVGWTNKNNTLKEGYDEYRGEWKNKFKKMLITPYPSYRPGLYGPSLTYGYLMPSKFQYDLHLVDKFGDAWLMDIDNRIYKKSTMTKLNEAGLNI